MFNKKTARSKRALRVRARIKRQVAELGRPRVCIIKSNNNIGAQLIMPDGSVLADVHTSQFKNNEEMKGEGKVKASSFVGRKFGERVVEKGVTGKLACDCSGHKYHGRVAAFLEGLRESKELIV